MRYVLPAPDVRAADKILLPGVGAFYDAKEITKTGLDTILKEKAASERRFWHASVCSYCLTEVLNMVSGTD